MRLLCLSDMHGELRHYESPAHNAHVAVIAGDVTPATHAYYGGKPSGLSLQAHWFAQTFLPWVETLPVDHVVMTWGNHDHLGEHPELYRSLVPVGHKLRILVNESCVIDGVRFHGVPQTPRFYDWAFNEDDTAAGLGRFWKLVPTDTDVLISHGPPRGTVDWVGDARRGERVGSDTQEAWLKSENAPNLSVVICGHIHAAGGQHGWCGRTRVENVAIVNEAYRVVREPRVVEIAK